VTPHSDEGDQRIIVGIDGSACSVTALRWAIAQARLTGATIEAIAAWQEPAIYRYSYGWPLTTPEGDSIPTLTEKVLQATIAEVVADGDQPVEVHTRVVQGHPAQVLTEAAAGALLLVLGSRGHGAFSGILLGSVSHHCVQHAPCPVVVVPVDQTTAAPNEQDRTTP
jgi:nucleotide-binding universal stress UspA family protein